MTHTEQYEIRNRYTDAVQFTATIECTPGTPASIKSGLAVKVAVKSRANLSRANLSGANLYGEKMKRILASVLRTNDGYTFNLCEMQKGPPKIVAGCRFMTIDAYVDHVAKRYPYTAKARETLRILDLFRETVAAEYRTSKEG